MSGAVVDSAVLTLGAAAPTLGGVASTLGGGARSAAIDLVTRCMGSAGVLRACTLGGVCERPA